MSTVSTKREKSVLHRAALAYASQGIKVFPCKPLSKVPATEHGFLDASADPEQINRWWSENREYNLAMCPADAGWLVVDEETYAAEYKPDWFKPFGDLPPTRIHQSARGGRHRIYEGVGPSSTRRLAPKVDTRSVGGYIVLPPSVVFDEESGITGHYRALNNLPLAELPEWISEKLARSSKKAEAPAGVEWDDPGNVGRAIDYVKRLPPTRVGDASDSRALQAAAVCRDLGCSQAKSVEIMMAHWRCTPKTLDWVTLKVRNAWKYAQNEPGCYARPPMAKTWQFVIDRMRAAGELEESEGWGEPMDLQGEASIVGEAVLTRDMLPPVIADFAFDEAERLGVTPAMVAIPALAVCAAALHDEIRVQPKANDTTWTEPARLWCTMLAPPSAYKSPALASALGPLRKIEAGWEKEDTVSLAQYESRLADHKAARTARNQAIAAMGKNAAEVTPKGKLGLEAPPVKPKKRRIEYTDTTMEALAYGLVENERGVLIVHDELIGWVGSFDVYRPNGGGGKDRAAALQLWNGGVRHVDRVRVGGTVTVPNWGASVFGSIQPDKLHELMAKSTLDSDGFLQRFLPFYGERINQGQDRAPDDAAICAYGQAVRSILELEPTGRALRLANEAQGPRMEVEDLTYAFVNLPSTLTALQSHLGKWSGTYARLLLTLHALEWAGSGATYEDLPAEISVETARMARDLMLRFFLPNAIRFYSEFFRAQDGEQTDARWISDHILTHGLESVSARDVKRAYHIRGEDNGAVERAMAVLEHAQWVKAAPAKKGSKVWNVNPIVHTRFAERATSEKLRREAEIAKIRAASEHVENYRMGQL